MNQSAPNPNQKKLDSLRLRASLAMPEWGITAKDGHTHLIASDGPENETVALVPDTASYDNREFLLNLPTDIIFLLKMYDRLVEMYRRAIGAPPPRAVPENENDKNYAAECAMKCQDGFFLTYLRQRHGADTSDAERVNTRVRSILNIKSRAELNSDPAAAARWLSLRADFDNWRRAR